MAMSHPQPQANAEQAKPNQPRGSVVAFAVPDSGNRYQDANHDWEGGWNNEEGLAGNGLQDACIDAAREHEGARPQSDT